MPFLFKQTITTHSRKLRASALLATTFAVYFMLVSFYGTTPVALNSGVPPQGNTGATGSYCTSCHGGASLNTAGGSVLASGLPNGNYAAGQKYNFSITISHKDADRKKWGFSVIAINAVGAPVGSFSRTNANATVNGNELSHSGAVATTPQKSYTYTGLSWTAPVVPGANDQTIRFYFVGNAANGTGGTGGDFIYSGSSQAKFARIYTFNGSGNWSEGANWAGGNIPPDTLNGADAEIIISPSESSECILNKGQVLKAGAKLKVLPGASLKIPGGFQIK